MSFREGKLPNSLKKSKVVQLHKKTKERIGLYYWKLHTYFCDHFHLDLSEDYFGQRLFSDLELNTLSADKLAWVHLRKVDTAAEYKRFWLYIWTMISNGKSY